MSDEKQVSSDNQEQQRLIAALRESEILRELAGLLASSLNITEILQLLVKRTTEVCRVERSAVWLVDDAHEIFQPTSYHIATPDLDQTVIEIGDTVWSRCQLPAGDPVLSRLLDENGMIVVDDLRTEKSMRSIAEKFLVHAVLLVAMTREERIIGMMSLDDPGRSRTFTDEQKQLARAIGQQAALAIDNARLYRQAQTQRERAEQLIERAQSIYQVAQAVNTCENLSDVLQIAVEGLVRGLNAAGGTVLLLDADTQRLVSVATPQEPIPFTISLADMPTCFQAAMTGASQFVLAEHTKEKERQWYDRPDMGNTMLVPFMAGTLIADGREEMRRTLPHLSDCIGIAFINYKAGSYPSRGHYAFAQDIAVQCSLAIEKTRLSADVQKAAREATERANTMNAIFQAMTEGITVLDQEGQVLLRNNAVAQFFNADFYDKNIPSLKYFLKHFPTYTLDGTPITTDNFPLMRALRGERIRGERVRARRGDGKERVLEINVTHLLDDNRKQIGVVSALRDVTEQTRVEERIQRTLETMLHVAEAVSGVTDINDIMQNVLSLAMNALNCDRGIVQLYDSETSAFTPFLSQGYNEDSETRWLTNHAIWNNTEQGSVHEFYTQLLDGSAIVLHTDKCPDQSIPHQHIMVLAAPITHNDRILGLMMLEHSARTDDNQLQKKQRHEFTGWDQTVAEGIAQLAGLAIEQSRWQQEVTEARIREATMRKENSFKDELLAMAAHEFKNPISVILAESQLASRRLRKSEHTGSLPYVTKAFAIIETQTHSLTNIVRTYLDVPQIKDGQLKLRMKTVDLADIAEKSIEIFDITTRRHQIQCVIEPSAHPCLVRGDESSLTQIIANLVQNAIKYSPDGGPITLSLRQCPSAEGSLIEVAVEDKGLGIPPEAQTHLFERFYRASNIDKHKTAGFGLGLYIVGELLQLHGGTIHVESSGKEGEGSRFIFTLPLLESEARKRA